MQLQKKVSMSKNLIRGYAVGLLLTSAINAQEVSENPADEEDFLIATIFSAAPEPNSDFASELENIRAQLAQVTAERDSAQGELNSLRADVDAIQQAQSTAQIRATSLATDLRAARSRIDILEENIQTARDVEQQQIVTLQQRETQLSEAMTAAHSCGTNLVNSENRARTIAERLATSEQENHDYLQNLDNLKSQLAERENNLTQAHAQIEKQDAAITTMNHDLEQRTDNLQNLRSQLQERDNLITTTQNELSTQNNQIKQYQSQLTERDQAILALQEQLTQRAEIITKLETQLAEQENSLAVLQKQLNSNNNTITNLNGDLANLTQEHANLQVRLTTVEQEKNNLQKTLTKANQDWNELNAQQQNLDERYRNLIATLAPIDGGTLDAKTAQDRAAEINNRYRALWEKHLRRSRDYGLMAQIEVARRDLFFAQYQVMRVNGGGELYILRPNDSLSILARLAYGDGSRVTEIRRANAHLLDNKIPLVVGTTLIVP